MHSEGVDHDHCPNRAFHDMGPKLPVCGAASGEVEGSGGRGKGSTKMLGVPGSRQGGRWRSKKEAYSRLPAWLAVLPRASLVSGEAGIRAGITQREVRL